MTYFFQIWAFPGLNLSEPLSLNPDFTVKSVTVQPPGKPPFMCTLIQLEAQRESESASPEPQFRRLGQVLTRLSFALLCPFSVFSARVVPSGAKKGDQLSAMVFPGVPPGIALVQAKVGFRKRLGSSTSFLVEDIPPQVEAAIGWFLAGNNAPNSVQQVLCHWIGLESLAPVIEGPWRCPECEAELERCPACAEPTRGPKTVQTVRGFLRNDLGVSNSDKQVPLQTAMSGR